MPERELASFRLAILCVFQRGGISGTSRPSGGAWLKLRPQPADLERNTTQLTGDLRQKMDD
jgi:hypothetical protein